MIPAVPQGAARFSLPQRQRLRRRDEFGAALRGKRVAASAHFAAWAKHNGLRYARLGVVAAKRIAKRAVDRNRARRLVREAFRRAQAGLAGLDVVVQLRRPLDRRASADCREELACIVVELDRWRASL